MTHTLNDLFQRLSQVHTLQFESRSLNGSKMDWNCSGAGHTEAVLSDSLLTFHDHFRLDNGRPCHDKKQWQLADGALIFAHYRNQIFEPIFTFRAADGVMVADRPYACIPDDYFGELAWHGDDIIFTIKIIGSRKNELIRYVYR